MAESMTALVVEADEPLDNMILVGPLSRGSVRILIDSVAPQIYTTAKFKLDRDHWLVPGMSIPVSIDPAKPAEFQIEWDAIPSMRERVAANDPVLVDPVETRKRLGVTITKATSPIDVSKLPEEIQEQLRRAQSLVPPPVDHFAESESQATMLPAPRDKVRAVVRVVTTTVTLVSDAASDEGGSGGHYLTADGRHDVVLSVRVLGRTPYAVFVHNFKQPRRKNDVLGAGLPALVSLSDPNDVEVLWDEVPGLKEQITTTLAEANQRMGVAQERIEAQQKQMMEEIAASTAKAQAAASVPGGPPVVATAPQLPPEMLETMKQNAKMALAAIKDPAVRQMLIQQYTIAGIPIDEQGNIIE